MYDVQAVANRLLKSHSLLLRKNNCKIDELSALAGLHDIGKISPGFQMKSTDWLKMVGLEQEARNCRWDAIHESDHSRITQYALQNYLEGSGLVSAVAEYWAAIAGAHHGRLHQPGIQKPKGSNIGDKWDNRRSEFMKLFLGNSHLSSFSIDDSWPLFWWAAGLIPVAD
jgi:CRISPR-associated endonuclease/helicase Cas3